MSVPEPSFRDVDRMLAHLETAIDKNAATPALLAAMQKRLDAVDALHKDDPTVQAQYHKLFELQALIHGTNKKEAEAKRFIAGAIKMAGGVNKLSSRLLKQYIATHPAAKQPAVAPSRHSAATTPPARTQPSTVAAKPAKPEKPAKPAKAAKLRPPRSKKRKLVIFIVVGGLIAVAAAAVLLWPVIMDLTSPYSAQQREAIDKQNIKVDSLNDEYATCTAAVKQTRQGLDEHDVDAVDAYNDAVADCDDVRSRQNDAVDTYNELLKPQDKNAPQ